MALLTLTMRHSADERLGALWDGLSYAWGKVTSGRGWREDVAGYGVAGWVRVVEVTVGDNGWHVHVHALLFLNATYDTHAAVGWTVENLGASMFTRWRDALQRKGFASPLAGAGGLDVKLLDGDSTGLADYFTKAVYGTAPDERAGLELARGDLKSGRGGNRNPWQLLRDLIGFGLADDLDLWLEWERCSRGRRQMTWSRGLRSQLVAGREQTDEELAEATVDGAALLLIPAGDWHRVCFLRATSRVLDAAEADDTGDALRALLADLGVGWDPPPI